MTTARRIIFATVLVVFCLSVTTSWSADSLKKTKIRGYVTSVVSSTEFEIEDYRITRDAGFVFDLENVSPDLNFKAEDIRVGVELEIQGMLNETTGELHATAIAVDLEQFRPLKQTAIIAAPPQGVTRTENGWTGRLFADGQRIVITEKTQLLFKPTNREKKELKAQTKKDAAEDTDDDFELLSTFDQVTVGMAMTYEGRRNPEDGTVAADRIEFSRNDLEDGEAKLWKSLKLSVKPPQGPKPGELKINRVGKFKLFPDEEVQGYVQTLGTKLIPAYQQDVPASELQKIPFQFFVVIEDEPNAFALPNGIVVVHSGLIDLLENEAQLAAVVGHEIAHATQEHTWRQTQFHKKGRFALAIASAVAAGYGIRSLSDLLDLVQAAIQNGYQRSLENQADRVGLDYMVGAGYDPRQAPQVWKLMTKKFGLQPTNFFYSSHDNHATRRSYLMNELKNNYRDLDYSTVKIQEEPFKAIQEKVKAATPGKKRIRVS